MSLLKVNNLSIGFGGLLAVDDLSFEVAPKTIYGLIGPNGAGKTTVFNCISRFYTPDKGQVHLNRENKNIDLLKLEVHQVIDHGMVRTFQNVELIKTMSVIDNLLIGLHRQMKGSLIGDLTGYNRKRDAQYREKAVKILQFLGLEAIGNEMAGAQPYGVLKLIELGRTLISEPALIILDEPAAGMNHTETDALAKLIMRVRDELGVTVLLVEHDMALVMSLCERICVISFGKKIAEGTPEEIRNNPLVQEAYLGKEEE